MTDRPTDQAIDELDPGAPSTCRSKEPTAPIADTLASDPTKQQSSSPVEAAAAAANTEHNVDDDSKKVKERHINDTIDTLANLCRTLTRTEQNKATAM
uniref:Uncharacterized protein n=1 Tax=Peronospora matthiolae TaxID=2874970 RepID=A0AAV1UJY0_9STRA